MIAVRIGGNRGNSQHGCVNYSRVENGRDIGQLEKNGYPGIWKQISAQSYRSSI
jgi:hypothetical protein